LRHRRAIETAFEREVLSGEVVDRRTTHSAVISMSRNKRPEPCWTRKRDRLFRNPEAVAREFNLRLAEIQAINLLDRRTFEQMVARLR
jgi:hypothetical protein